MIYLKMTFKIYKVVCSLTKKTYIGVTSRSLEIRLKEHFRCPADTYFYRSIKKYGKENFSIELLEECNSRKESYEKENFWISKLGTVAPQGYNSNSGGLGGQANPSKETRQKMRKAKVGCIPWNKGKKGVQKHSEETRRKISQALTVYTEEEKLKIKAKRFDKFILNWYNNYKGQ